MSVEFHFWCLSSNYEALNFSLLLLGRRGAELLIERDLLKSLGRWNLFYSGLLLCRAAFCLMVSKSFWIERDEVMVRGRIQEKGYEDSKEGSGGCLLSSRVFQMEKAGRRQTWCPVWQHFAACCLAGLQQWLIVS